MNEPRKSGGERRRRLAAPRVAHHDNVLRVDARHMTQGAAARANAPTGCGRAVRAGQAPRSTPTTARGSRERPAARRRPPIVSPPSEPPETRGPPAGTWANLGSEQDADDAVPAPVLRLHGRRGYAPREAGARERYLPAALTGRVTDARPDARAAAKNGSPPRLPRRGACPTGHHGLVKADVRLRMSSRAAARSTSTRGPPKAVQLACRIAVAPWMQASHGDLHGDIPRRPDPALTASDTATPPLECPPQPAARRCREKRRQVPPACPGSPSATAPP